MNQANGTFEVTIAAQPPHDVVDGVSIGRVTIAKRFAGELAATSAVEMLGVRTPVDGSAGYVAIERVTGALAGRTGTFVLQHVGAMARGQLELHVTVVPDSGTGELTGLRGRMAIEIVEGVHRYALAYEL